MYGDGLITDWVKESWFDGERLRFTLVTSDGNHFVFDVRTGQIISESRVRWPRYLAFLITAVLLLRGLIALVARDWFSAWRNEQYAEGRLPRGVLVVAGWFLGLTLLAWYATIRHYRPWCWVVASFLTLACAVGVVNLARWKRRREAAKPIAWPRMTRAADLALVALGLGFAVLAVVVY